MKLNIYTADLTHDYSAISSGTFPLGIGFVSSTLKQYLNSDANIEIFKYPKDLDRALKNSLPDVFLFSVYLWNTNLSLAFARKIKKENPKCLVVIGGPNFSKDVKKRIEFLEANDFIDFLIYQEGEIACLYLMKKYIELDLRIDLLKKKNLLSTITILETNKPKIGVLADRLGRPVPKIPADELSRDLSKPPFSIIKELDDIPSPYLSGLFDKFFDNNLYPLIETNRGCPFSCSFCQQGESYFTKVVKRSSKINKHEFEYIAERMKSLSPGVARVEIADPNFAMFSEDLDFCRFIREIQEKYKWPMVIGCSTGKNKPDRILDAVSKLYPDSLVISNSMQSTNPDTLAAIKRSNISMEGYGSVQKEIHKRGLRSMADVILGLPMETKDSHFKAVFDLIDSGVQEFTSYQAMILKSTDLELPETRQKYGLKTKFRAIPRALGTYVIMGESINLAEVEEISVGTDTLTFDDYLQSRRLHLVTMIFHNSGVFSLASEILKINQVSVSKYIERIYFSSLEPNFKLSDIFEKFLQETTAELFDAEHDALRFYRQDENILKAKNGEIAGNLLFKYLARSTFEYWENACEVAVDALENLCELTLDEADDLKNYFKARIVNVSESPVKKEIVVRFKTDIVLDESNSRKNDREATRLIKFKLDDLKYNNLVQAKTRYPNNFVGWGLLLSQLRLHNVTRFPCFI